MAQGMIRLCFVCLGNICRSPTAEAVMRHVVAEAGRRDEFAIDSAGVGGWHVGEPADRRARAAAAQRGYRITGVARQFQAGDFQRFDYVLAMDADNLHALNHLAAAPDEVAKVHLLRAFDPDSPPGAEVPDPYYGGPSGFEEVLNICEAACRGLLARLS
jgi:protein-tyrosine phosphatase